MNSRTEAAAKAQFEAVTGKPWELAKPRSAKLCREDSAAIVKAADAHDAAHGVHRVSLDDATVERAARALHAETHKIAICKCCHPLWDTERENVRVQYRNEARAVLVAPVHHAECWMKPWFDNEGASYTGEDFDDMEDNQIPRSMNRSGIVDVTFMYEWIEWSFK